MCIKSFPVIFLRHGSFTCCVGISLIIQCEFNAAQSTSEGTLGIEPVAIVVTILAAILVILVTIIAIIASEGNVHMLVLLMMRFMMKFLMLQRHKTCSRLLILS